MRLPSIVFFCIALLNVCTLVSAAELQRDGLLIDSRKCAVRVTAYGLRDSLIVTQQLTYDTRRRLVAREDLFGSGMHFKRVLTYDNRDSVLTVFDCNVAMQPPETLSYTVIVRDSLGRPLSSDTRYGGASRPRDYTAWKYGDSTKIVMTGTGASKTDTSLRMASRVEITRRPDSLVAVSLSYSKTGEKTIVSTIRYGRDTAAVDSVDRFVLDTASRQWIIQSRELYTRTPGTVVINKYVFVNATSRWIPSFFTEMKYDTSGRDTMVISYALDSLGRRVGSIREDHTRFDAAGHPYRVASGTRPQPKTPYTPSWDGLLSVNNLGSLDSCTLMRADGTVVAVYKNDAEGYPVDIAWYGSGTPRTPVTSVRRIPPVLLPHQVDAVPIGYDLNGVRFHIEWKNLPSGAKRK